jgi:predicted nucleic acid-binding protein
MGQLKLPAFGAVYVDTNAVIYRLERIEPYLTASGPLWDALDAGLASVVTSELTLLEVLVKPLRQGNSALASLYRTVLFGTIGLTSVPITRSILETAAQLRAVCQLKTPDAIHAATALEQGARLFVRNDAGFRRVAGLPIAVLNEVAAS